MRAGAMALRPHCSIQLSYAVRDGPPVRQGSDWETRYDASPHLAGNPIGQGLRPAGRVRESNSLGPDNPIAAARLMAQIVDRPGKNRSGACLAALIPNQL